MTADNLVIEYTLNYNGGLLAEDEKSPHLMLWSSLPGRKKHFVPVLWQSKSSCKAKPIHARLFLPLNARDGARLYDEKRRRYTLPLDSTLGVQARCCTPNEEGRIAIRGCGETLFALGLELLKRQNDNERMRKASFDLQLVYHTHTRKDGSLHVKGTAVLCDLHAYLASSPNEPVQLFADGNVDEFSYVSTNAQAFQSDIDNINERSVAPFTDEAAAHGYDLKPHTDEGKRVHATIYATPAGAQPGITFGVVPERVSIVPAKGTKQRSVVCNYLHELAICALRRDNLPMKEFIPCVNTQLKRADNTYDNAFTRCCGVSAQMLAIPSNSSPYIGDFIEVDRQVELTHEHHSKRSHSTHAEAKLASWHAESLHGYIAAREKRELFGSKMHAALVAGKEANENPSDERHERIAVESFNELVDYASGDCEDLGCLAMRIFNTWAWTDWDDEEDDELVATVGRLFKQYAAFLTLGSVRSAALGNDGSSIVEEDAGAIDSEQDRRQKYGAHMWCLVLPIVKFLSLVRKTVSDFSVSELKQRGADFIVAPWVAALPDLNVEGTGMVTSLLRPPIAYVVAPSIDGRSVPQLKAEVLERVADTARVYDYLQSTHNSAWLSRLAVVRQQKQQLKKANYRLTKFYRQLTHMYGTYLMRYGFSNVDFIVGYVGERVPMPESGAQFEDEPLIGKLKAPERTHALNEQPPSPISLVASSVGVQLQVGSVSASSASSSFEGAFLSIANGKHDLESRRSHKRGFRYGAALEDVFESNAALLPGTRLDARNLRTIAVLQRHSPPVTMPGDFAEQREMQEARMEARLIDEGVDEKALEADVDRHFDDLENRIDKLLVSGGKKKWTTSMGVLTLHTFIMPSEMLATKSAVDHLMSDIEKHFRSGVLVSARVLMEEPLLHQRNIVLQFIADPQKVPKSSKTTMP